MKMSKLLAIVAAFGLSIAGANAASGIFGSYIQVDGTWYGNTEWGTDVTDFQGADLGTFTAGNTALIGDAEVDTFKNSGSDVTGAEYQYRVYPAGSPAGAHTAVSLGFTSDQPFTGEANATSTSGVGDQQWSTPASQPDILNGLSAGSYTLEVFYHITTATDGDIYDNNNNNPVNYTASFTVVPEPATMALFGMGLAGLFVARRRRA